MRLRGFAGGSSGWLDFLKSDAASSREIYLTTEDAEDAEIGKKKADALC